MIKKLFSILLCVLALSKVNAQSFKLKNISTGKEITGDSVILKLYDNGFIGWQSLNIEIEVINTSATTKLVGAQKIEYDVINPKDASHSLCWAGNCYDEKTYDAPIRDSIKAGKSNTTFSAHLIFNDTILLKPMLYHVAYRFYDVNNTSDEAIVKVNFYTQKLVGIEKPMSEKRLSLYPNPTTDFVNIVNQKGHLVITDISGRIVISMQTTDNTKIDMRNYPQGVYLFSLRCSDGMYRNRVVVGK